MTWHLGCLINRVDKKFIKLSDSLDQRIRFSVFDLLDQCDNLTKENAQKTIDQLKNTVRKIKDCLMDKMFICILVKNVFLEKVYYPFAWEIASEIKNILSLKDEKICCIEKKEKDLKNKYFKTLNNSFYCLYFKKDENSENLEIKDPYNFVLHEATSQQDDIKEFSSWRIVKPRPRKKDEILHPAKYPEELVKIFIQNLSKENDNILDPMCGTGSTQIASLEENRNAYGCELSTYFYKIANKRCEQIINPDQEDLFSEKRNCKFKLINMDAKKITKAIFPKIDYIITSPPYWDMLNVKGAENQAKRREKGLKLKYSENKKDLGNIENYNKFVDELINIYFNLLDNLKSNGYFTIIVKNIKKGGVNYPLAWDLSRKLNEKLIILPEFFWLQDDQNIAPYGYGNTFVTNTFHHYCLTFQKK